MGFECSLENSYSHDSFPLSVKEVFIGSPYSWRTCAWVVLPLTNCPETVSREASAMLSLPLLVHPARNADESPAATTIRHAITSPQRCDTRNCYCSPSLAPNDTAHYLSTCLPSVRRITCEPKFVWDLVRATNDRQRQYGTPADNFEQKLPRILSSVNSKQVGTFGLGECALSYFRHIAALSERAVAGNLHALICSEIEKLKDCLSKIR